MVIISIAVAVLCYVIVLVSLRKPAVALAISTTMGVSAFMGFFWAFGGTTLSNWLWDAIVGILVIAGATLVIFLLSLVLVTKWNR